MTARPEHLPPTRWHPNTAELRPLGLDAPGMRVGGRTYWQIKLDWFADRHLSPEQLAFVGAEDPFLDGDADRWRTDRGWRSAEDAMRTVTRDDEDYYEKVQGVRWLADLGDATWELSE